VEGVGVWTIKLKRSGGKSEEEFVPRYGVRAVHASLHFTRGLAARFGLSARASVGVCNRNADQESAHARRPMGFTGNLSLGAGSIVRHHGTGWVWGFFCRRQFGLSDQTRRRSSPLSVPRGSALAYASNRVRGQRPAQAAFQASLFLRHALLGPLNMLTPSTGPCPTAASPSQATRARVRELCHSPSAGTIDPVPPATGRWRGWTSRTRLSDHQRGLLQDPECNGRLDSLWAQGVVDR